MYLRIIISKNVYSLLFHRLCTLWVSRNSALYRCLSELRSRLGLGDLLDLLKAVQSLLRAAIERHQRPGQANTEKANQWHMCQTSLCAPCSFSDALNDGIETAYILVHTMAFDTCHLCDYFAFSAERESLQAESSRRALAYTSATVTVQCVAPIAV